MEKLKGSQRRFLRSLANTLKPHVFIGKNGLSEPVLVTIDESLDNFELIKIRFLEFKDQKKELSLTIENQCRCEMVGLVGHVGLFYRQHPDPQKRSIHLP